MTAKQTLLFPDPRPLVERLGSEFFRGLPECPGVYLMHDARAAVLYVGKAKNLRKRLNSYRVANPDRMRRRHLRLLRAVMRIEWEQCADEASALLREAGLICELKPPFNRAGTWAVQPRFLCWRIAENGLGLGLFDQVEPGWNSWELLGGGAVRVYAMLARVLWLGLNPERQVSELPAGWTAGAPALQIALASERSAAAETMSLLDQILSGNAEPLSAWLERRVSQHPFDRTMLAEDLEALRRRFQRRVGSVPLAW